jgi:hypothetical protein
MPNRAGASADRPEASTKPSARAGAV